MSKDLNKKERENLLDINDFVYNSSMAIVLFLIAALCNLTWGTWESFAISIVVICGFVALIALAGIRSPLQSRLEVENPTSLLSMFIFFAIVYGIFGLIHVLWWSDHLVRMLQIYLGISIVLIPVVAGSIGNKLSKERGE